MFIDFLPEVPGKTRSREGGEGSVAAELLTMKPRVVSSKRSPWVVGNICDRNSSSQILLLLPRRALRVVWAVIPPISDHSSWTGRSRRYSRAPGAFGQLSQGGIVGMSMQGQELHWMIFGGPFTLKCSKILSGGAYSLNETWTP